MITAKIKFIVDRTFYSNYRPMIKIRDDMYNSCQLDFKDKNIVNCNENIETYMLFVREDLVYPYLYIGKEFRMYEGNIKVGEGRIISIV